MRIEVDAPCPLPEDPVLGEVAGAMEQASHWAWVLDVDWNLVYMTDEVRRTFGGSNHLAPLVVGEPMFGSASLKIADEWLMGPTDRGLWADFLAAVGGMMLADVGGDRDRLRAMVDPSLRYVVEELSPSEAVSMVSRVTGTAGLNRRRYEVWGSAVRIRDENGHRRGTVVILKPMAPMSALATMAVQRDLGHLDRMQQVIAADRRPAAILFGDLEGSSVLSRRLSTAGYFALGRRIVRAVDQCVIEAGGLVGRHVGDGVVAFFPTALFDSESAAAAACVEAALAVRDAMADVAQRSQLDPSDAVMRFGLHWGSTLYIGGITTGARSEVTALGDEINEAARIEACATGGRILASKPLIERLADGDAKRLGMDPDRMTYTQLADLATATEKAKRDAPAVAVSEL